MKRVAKEYVSLVIVTAAFAACGPSNASNAIEGPASADSVSSPESSGETASTGQAAVTAGPNRIQLSQDKGLCLGISGSAAAGLAMTMQPCETAAEGQSFSLDDNGLLHLTDSLCVAASLDANAPLALATCSTTADDQVFAVQGDALVSSASALCLAPNVSTATAGTRAWMCDCDVTSATQKWSVSDAVLGTASVADEKESVAVQAPALDAKAAKPANRASVLSTVKASSMASLTAKVPSRLKAQMENIKAAASQYNLQPQLLVAIAMQESTGGSDQNAYSNQGGMFQFTNADTWKEYGTKKLSDRQNDALSVTAAANYIGFLINKHKGNLAGALREYNGAIADGGLPKYVTQVFAKMRGRF